MYQLIHNLALAAALVTLIAALWQDWGLLPTLKKMIISYLGFFILGSIMTLAVRLVPHFESKDEIGESETE
ncbi:MAG: hypothetical protein KOO60_03130 [Gemmatimonadales bacterium]|nr:hypothetical protein [Gemmatimonadales bacterium]